jgi:hypothetical protein
VISLVEPPTPHHTRLVWPAPIYVRGRCEGVLKYCNIMTYVRPQTWFLHGTASCTCILFMCVRVSVRFLRPLVTIARLTISFVLFLYLTCFFRCALAFWVKYKAALLHFSDSFTMCRSGSNTIFIDFSLKCAFNSFWVAISQRNTLDMINILIGFRTEIQKYLSRSQTSSFWTSKTLFCALCVHKNAHSPWPYISNHRLWTRIWPTPASLTLSPLPRLCQSFYV